MYYIVYNGKSNRGMAIRRSIKLEKKLQKRSTCTRVDLFTITGKEREFCETLSSSDCLVLVGGDGTIHHFLNHIYPMKVEFRVFVLACGRGNDLSREYSKKKMFEITHLVNSLPVVTINGQDKGVFINGLGMGVDSCVCEEQLKNGSLGIKESYFKTALRVFRKFTPYDLDIQLDGVSYHFKKVWFFVCNHGKYFGGGMKITPKAIREDDVLDLCIVHNIKLRTLLLIFPLVFLGLHTKFKKKNVTFLKGKDIKVFPSGCTILQQDGEVSFSVEKLEIHR